MVGSGRKPCARAWGWAKLGFAHLSVSLPTTKALADKASDLACIELVHRGLSVSRLAETRPAQDTKIYSSWSIRPDLAGMSSKNGLEERGIVAYVLTSPWIPRVARQSILTRTCLRACPAFDSEICSSRTSRLDLNSRFARRGRSA